jgi:hypothetical protein
MNQVVTRRREISKILADVDAISDAGARIKELRRICEESVPVATIIQLTYHPDCHFKLPEGDVPESLWKRSNHQEYGVLYYNIKRLGKFWEESNIPPFKREQAFFDLLSSVTPGDADLMIGVKNKRLPYRALTEKFCKKALPELFPTEETAVS